MTKAEGSQKSPNDETADAAFAFLGAFVIRQSDFVISWVRAILVLDIASRIS
jgi:hypothetical protein